jgi:K+-transporting ATPase ATPase B chain
MAERARRISIWDPSIIRQAILDSFRKLDPRVQVRNPVMFIVEVGSLVTTVIWVKELLAGAGNPLFTGQVAFWLWFTVLFANFAEAMAEGRGKAQAATLRRTRAETMALRIREGRQETVPASELRKGDDVRVEAGQIIPGDGEVIQGSRRP